ncbi:MAG: OmpA family protein [Burkholderiales bacterium]|nr:OmpA family protein [Burkholderiales bacterium]
MSRLNERSPANWRAFDSASGWIALLLALLLIVLWMMGRGPNAAGCCAVPSAAGTAASTPAATTASAAAAVGGLAWGADGKVTLTGNVKDEATRKAIIDAATARYGAGNVLDQLTVNANAASKVVLSGTVATEAEKRARGDWAASLYGPGVAIDNQLQVKAPDAGAAAKPPTVKIYFETGKVDIDAKDRDAIASVLGYLKANAGAKAVLSGFHDPRGDKAKNEQLAKDRAKSVREVLRAAGIDEARIEMRKPQETTGSGDNAEARRVELSVE